MITLDFWWNFCQSKKTLPQDENEITSKLNILDPESARDLSYSSMWIAQVTNHFTQIVQKGQFNDLDDQQRAFRVAAKDLMLSAKRVPKFWHKVGPTKDAYGKDKFELLIYSMENIIFLPYSSAWV